MNEEGLKTLIYARSTNVNHIQGTCFTMCPRSEMILRQRENLVHKLECKINVDGRRTIYSDPQKMVKEYNRPAAGVTIDAINVRPLLVLQKTITYLFSNVCSTEDVSWRIIYEFVENRLRAIRQDITVQALNGKEVLKILVPMTRFYIYANYRFYETDDENYDPYLNLKQLHEVLLSILSIHENTDYKMQTRTVDVNQIMRQRDNDSSEPYNTTCESYDTTCENFSSTCEPYDTTCENLSSTCENFSSTCENLSYTRENFNSTCENFSDEEEINILTSSFNANLKIEDRETNISETVDFPYSNIRVVPSQDKDIPHNSSSLGVYDQDRECGLVGGNLDEESVVPILKYSELEEIHALYLLVHLGNTEAIAHVVQLPEVIKTSFLVSCVLKANLSWVRGNHLPLIRLASRLPPILLCALHLHLNKVQRHALNVMSCGHSSSIQKYNVAELQQNLLFNSPESLIKSCNYYGLVSSESGIQFLKSNFKQDLPPVPSERATFVEEKLNQLLVKDLLLA